MKKISLVIPVKNEEKIIRLSIKKLEEYLKRIKVDYEMILVENGSTDNTLNILKELSEKNKKIKYATLQKASYGKAIKVGSLKAKYDIFIYSIDLTMGLTFIERAIKLLEKYPIVNGSRYMKESRIDRNILRHWTSSFWQPLVNFVHRSKYTDSDGLKAFRKGIGRKIIKKAICYENFFLTEILLIAHNSKIPFIEIPIDHIEKRNSKFSYIKLVFWQIINWISNYNRIKKLKI